MSRLTKAEAGKLVSLAVAGFPSMQNANMGPTVILWAKLLGDIPYPVAEKAVSKIIMTAKFFPTVSEVRDVAQKLILGDRRLPEPEEAWLEVMRQVDGIKQPQWSCPEIKEAVAAIGYRNICDCSVDGLGVIRGQFMRIYSTFKNRAEDGAVNVQLQALLGSDTAKLKVLEGGNHDEKTAENF